MGWLALMGHSLSQQEDEVNTVARSISCSRSRETESSKQPPSRAHPARFRKKPKALELQQRNLLISTVADNNHHQNKAAQIIQDILFRHEQMHKITQTFFVLNFLLSRVNLEASKHSAVLGRAEERRQLLANMAEPHLV